MIADQRTLIELGILPRSSGDWPLRPLLDRTHSARAHEALKRVLATPLEGRTAVIERQRVFRALPALLKDVRWDECLKDCEIVEGFLSSNYVLVPSGKAARTVFAIKHKEIVAYVVNNLHIVSRFIDQGSRLSTLLNGLTSDPLIQEVQRSLDAVCHHQALRSIGNVVRSKADLNHRLSEFDQLLRQDMRADD